MREEQEFRGWLSSHHPNVEIREYGTVVQLCVHGERGLHAPVEITPFSLRALCSLDSIDAHLKRVTEEVRCWERLRDGLVVDKRAWEICFEDETEKMVTLKLKERV